MQAIFWFKGKKMAKTPLLIGFKAFGVALFCCAVASGATAAEGTRTKTAKESAPQATIAASETLPKSKEDVRPGLAGSFLSGRFARQNQDIKEAARYLSETLSHDPNNEDLQQETMRMHLLAGNMEEATSIARGLAKNKTNDPLVASLLMLERVKAKDFSGAKAAISQSSNVGLFGLIRPVVLEWLAVASNERKGAVDMQSVTEKAGFFAPFINYHTALMDDMLGDKSGAQAAYAKANVDPAITPYRVVEAMANFYMRQGKWDEAQALYDAYAKANPQSSLIPEKLVKGEVPKLLVADASQGLAELFFTTASILFGEEAAQDTFLYLRIALELRPDFPPAQLMLANMYEQVADYQQAIATYDAIPEGSVFARRAEIRKALNYEALGEKDKALDLLDKLAARYPNDAGALITKGDMLRDVKDYEHAAESYSMAIARTEPLQAGDWPLLYARGISYERSDRWSKAEADFERALKLQPAQPDVLNYLAYSWLLMNKNLDKAREYLEIASSQRPDDGHIIDSVGWAYYLAGNYTSAVERFERAIELMPDDPTVNEHLGDAYWRVGREVEARYQWERALTFKPEQELVQALKDKINNGLPAAMKSSETPKSAQAHAFEALSPAGSGTRVQ